MSHRNYQGSVHLLLFIWDGGATSETGSGGGHDVRIVNHFYFSFFALLSLGIISVFLESQRKQNNGNRG